MAGTNVLLQTTQGFLAPLTVFLKTWEKLEGSPLFQNDPTII
jgi:hypothetical protein